MASITVNPQVLESTRNQIEGQAQEYHQLYNHLYSMVQELSQRWKGEDNIAFTNQIEGFRQDFEKMKQLMDSYAQFLHMSADSYTATQDSIKKKATTLRN